MLSPKNLIPTENGNVLFIVFLVLIMLTLLGTFAINSSKVEIDIAGIDRFHKVAFHNADSGIYTTPKLISESISAGAQIAAPGIAYYNNVSAQYDPQANAGDGTFFNEIMGFSANDADNEIRMNLADHDVEIDVQRGQQQNIAGSGIEFGAGIEGHGTGSMGGVIIPYGLTSNGEGPGSSVSVLNANYRKVVGTAGGL